MKQDERYRETVIYDAGTAIERIREQPWILPVDVSAAAAAALVIAAYVDGNRHFWPVFLLGLTQIAPNLSIFNPYQLLRATTQQVKLSPTGISQIRRDGFDAVQWRCVASLERPRRARNGTVILELRDALSKQEFQVMIVGRKGTRDQVVKSVLGAAQANGVTVMR